MPPASDNIAAIEYHPDRGRNLIQFSILPIRVRVHHHSPHQGKPHCVFIRTNLNQARRIRRQIIDQVDTGRSYSTDFYDILATYDSQADEYCADILLSDVGYFEFKVRVSSSRGQPPWVRWADGPNVGVTVTPLQYARGNSIYCAFIRQYVDEKYRSSARDRQLEDAVHHLEQRGAHVIPPGGNFKNFIAALPFIINDLGMKIIHLLPINPVPTSYGRMGMYGSPYATTDYFGIDHTYGTFSQYQTIEEQFIDLTSTIHGLGARVMLDMVINHAGWASSIHSTHPHWRKTGPDGKIISPGAWGVTWGDLVELDYSHPDLWRYMADVFLTWCRRGVDGFRLDAGYMVPLEVWVYIIANVRRQFPNTLFLLEGLGGPWDTTETLLTQGQMNWAYSELFQNYDRKQIVDYLDYAHRVSAEKGVLVHYAETHDNDRLAKKGKVHTRMRLYLSALTSFAGAWGITNGVEWLATEKIDVHRNTALNWGNPNNLVDDIACLNRILYENAAFWHHDDLTLVDLHNPDLLAFVRRCDNPANVIVVAINLNTTKSTRIKWDLASHLTDSQDLITDLLTDQNLPLNPERTIARDLPPGAALVYRLSPSSQPSPPPVPALYDLDPDRIALIYRILISRFAHHEVSRIDQEKLLRQVTDFRRFIALVNTASIDELIDSDLEELMNDLSPDLVDQYSSVWTVRDHSRQFLIPGDNWLMVHGVVPSTAQLETPRQTLTMESIPMSPGPGHATFFPPLPENTTALLSFNWKVQQGQVIQRQPQTTRYPIVSLPSTRQKIRPRTIYPLTTAKAQLQQHCPTVLLTNGSGALSQSPALPGLVNSKYDALLAVPADPADLAHRHALLKCTQETIQVGQKYFDLDQSFLVSFTRYPHPLWEFVYDDGEYFLRIERLLLMPRHQNTIHVRYILREANSPVTLTAKCYVESRSLHDQISLARQPDLCQAWPDATVLLPDRVGFSFAPQPRPALTVTALDGRYIHEPNWRHDFTFPLDAQRGLEPLGDAYSPGNFACRLAPGESQLITATAESSSAPATAHQTTTSQRTHVKQLLSHVPITSARGDRYVNMLTIALDQFIVTSDQGYQLFAGYPWLPARTREGLQCVPGLLAAGRTDVAQSIILQSARTAKAALLADSLGPNSPRAGLEASLRLFLAAAAFSRHQDDPTFWDRDVGDSRSLRQVLVQIYESLRDASPPAPCLDRTTALLFCPAGSSWMNTNHPRATPRSGYPVEIQAYWYQALDLIPTVYPPHAAEARSFRALIEQNFLPLYASDQRSYLADVLIADKNSPAAEALADPALRFNQLAAVPAALLDPTQAGRIVVTLAKHLLIPAGLRSLSEEPLLIPLEVRDSHGALLLDPHQPYCPHCLGPEATRRVAYHNGTAWPHAYLSFIEAYAYAHEFSELAVRQSLAYFEPLWEHLYFAGIGAISQMLDADFPHTPRSCYAYAPPTAEALRIYLRLKYPNNA